MTSTPLNEPPQFGPMLLLVDSGSSDYYFDDIIIPGLENHMLNVDVLETPHKISMAGNHILLGMRTGTPPGTVVDKGREAAQREDPRRYRFRYGAHPFLVKESSIERKFYHNRLQPAAPATEQTSAAVTTAL